MLDGLLSVFTGGLTGIIGVAIQRFTEYKTKQLEAEMAKDKMAHEIDMKHADAEIMQQEWASRTKVAEIEGAAKESVADAGAFDTALTSEPKRYSDETKTTNEQQWMFVMLDFVRGAVRPALTIYLCGITTVIYVQSKNLLGSSTFTPDQAYNLTAQIIETVLYLTTTCVLFWFGTRNKEKR